MVAYMEKRQVSLPASIKEAFDTACGLVAPTWPLDQMIAVNPFWEMRQQSATDVAARLSALLHATPVMRPSYYASLKDHPVRKHHLDAAAEWLGLERDRYHATEDEQDISHWHNVSDLLDSCDIRPNEMAWRDEIVHQVSQFCADAFRDDGDLAKRGVPGTLYALWLDSVRHDRGIGILMGTPGLSSQFEALPYSAEELLAMASEELAVTEASAELYAHALLLDVNGWASWVAYLRWQERLAGSDKDLSRDLLAIRMAWDLALWRYMASSDQETFRRVQLLWQRQIASPEYLLTEHARQQRTAWVWQRAAELAYQEDLIAKLSAPRPEPQPEMARRKMQAAFCIDVRSEVIRRHLEAQDQGIRTLGFAGFFGMPLSYQPKGTALRRPQLPGLLAPAIDVTEASDGAPSSDQNLRTRWSELGASPSAMFGLVEASGPLYALKLVRDAFMSPERKHPVNCAHEPQPLALSRDGEALSVEERADVAAGALHAMGLENNFAPVVLLVGHGSTSRNNPHSAGLDCGACCGQTGEINSRVFAEILNDFDVRKELQRRGVLIPAATRFVAALHDTTTDEIRCFDDELPIPTHMRQWLDAASDATRRERAACLGLDADDELAAALQHRSRNWAELRPEWALANNAAFIAAPRERTRHIDLEGRSFLHDYDWHQDPDNSVLELIMTAPMVVANWINTQYNASVTDNTRYGSGNKLLHNVVGGNIGVFEGNGGDLRIGLPMQSVHDGEQYMHTPLRLSVFLAAPADAIRSIYDKHDAVRELVDNDWLFLFRLDDHDGVQQLYRNEWLDMEFGDADQ